MLPLLLAFALPCQLALSEAPQGRVEGVPKFREEVIETQSGGPG